MPRRTWLISELPDINRCPHCHQLGLHLEWDEIEGENIVACFCGERVYRTAPLSYVKRILHTTGVVS